MTVGEYSEGVVGYSEGVVGELRVDVLPTPQRRCCPTFPFGVALPFVEGGGASANGRDLPIEF